MALLKLLLFLCFIICFQSTPTKSDPTLAYSFCPNTTTIASNTTYQANLNALFRSLTSNATSTNRSGFYATSAGNPTRDDEAVYGLFLCRGDQNTTSCHDCVAFATTSKGLPKICPNRKIAVAWYDECMVRYSNESIQGVLEERPFVVLGNTLNVTGNQTKFAEILGTTLNGLADQAAVGDDGSGKKYATKEAPFTSFQTIYALSQCTPDLSRDDCEKCLTIGDANIQTAQGAQILLPSCFVRYEIYPFYNGAANFTLPGTEPPPGPQTGPSSGPVGTGKKKKSTKVIIAIVVPVATIAVVLLTICICLIKKKAKKKDAVAVDSIGEDFTNADSLQYDLGTLHSATNTFSEENKLGEGGFGSVFKGTLLDGMEIAVKRLSKNSGQGVQEFKNEVLLVAKLQHRNLVRLLGFCVAGEEKLLVYEYVPNKSLDSFLFDPEKQGQLDWGRRYKIIGGIARGMLYLHQDSRLRIIHRDLKASNVLLDSDMNPKVSDFGMARIFGGDQTQGNTSRVVGTYGYMSPEYAMHGQFSVKSDVYSFGVLVLEIISGKRNSTFYESGYAEDLISYAWKLWRDGTPLEFVDPAIIDSYSSHEVMRCIHLGLLCVQESIDERPTMATAVLMLDSHSITLPVPAQPAFFLKSKVESNPPIDFSTDQSISKSVSGSINDVSITEMEPR